LQLNDALEFSSATIEKIPEHIGYLKSIGIDYGFGPTGFVEWILEHIHILCGTPWWASIALTAITFRIISFKAFVGASDNAAKMSTISHITKPLQQKMSEASRAGDTQRALMHRQELQLVYKRAGIKLWKSMAPLLQGLIGYGTFVLIRAMSNLPVPGLETGGILWFSNLTIPDPYFILPLATAGILHLVLRVCPLLSLHATKS
jgi:YidC/Oxa1 family membrane protein insertase